MAGVRTSIIEGPRPLPRDRHADPRYTLVCEEPRNVPSPSLISVMRQGDAEASAPTPGSDQAQFPNCPALVDQFRNGRIDPGTGELVDLQALDDLPGPTRGGHGE